MELPELTGSASSSCASILRPSIPWDDRGKVSRQQRSQREMDSNVPKSEVVNWSVNTEFDEDKTKQEEIPTSAA